MEPSDASCDDFKFPILQDRSAAKMMRAGRRPSRIQSVSLVPARERSQECDIAQVVTVVPDLHNMVPR